MLEPEVDPKRVARIADALTRHETEPIRSLCVAAAEVIGVHSAGVVLMSQGQVMGRLGASDDEIRELEDLEFTLGQGPCVDAYRTTKPVMAPDLATIDATRWPEFSHGALAAGTRAAFGFPLPVGTVCIGALNLYNHEIGQLTQDQFADAIAVAHVTARTVLSWQAETMPGALAWQLEDVPAHLAVVHQAAGRVSVQVGISVTEAQLLLRAYAFADNRPIQDVARDVAERRLRIA